MGITKSIGKNTLGGGKKMEVNLRTYNRSTHNLSYAWRSTMGVGTLVPSLCMVGLPGDTFDFRLNSQILTHPTLGPLFGTYKFQLDIFSCPIRLYNAMLHNNKLDVGLDMSKVKLPKMAVQLTSTDLPKATNKWSQVHPSSVLAYLGLRGWGVDTKSRTVKNGVPLLCYLDVFKNYYANKQETKWYAIMPQKSSITFIDNLQYDSTGKPKQVVGGNFTFIPRNPGQTLEDTYIVFRRENGVLDVYNASKASRVFDFSGFGTSTVTATYNGAFPVYGTLYEVRYKANLEIATYNLSDIDTMRENILKAGSAEITMDATNFLGCEYIKNILGRTSDKEGTQVLQTTYPSSGLILKTHQSDIFNNWVSTEWIDGDNGINAVTAVAIEDNKFTIDSLNLAKKVYDMLQRIAVSGGTYGDWINTVYTSSYHFRPETPVYEGGMSGEIIFQEVVSMSATEDEPLGSLAGRGTLSPNRKGGKLHIKCNEPCYILGIASITPRVDYCQGNNWDMELQTLNDLHKPALDAIGYQDLTENKMAWWRPKTAAVGKQPAWIDYMTNFNKTYGNFAVEDNEAFMVLNRYYDPENGDFINGKLNYTTYINPTDFNYTFAEQTLEAQDFWVQIGFGIKCRRVMSAKQIPNL